MSGEDGHARCRTGWMFPARTEMLTRRMPGPVTLKGLSVEGKAALDPARDGLRALAMLGTALDLPA